MSIFDDALRMTKAIIGHDYDDYGDDHDYDDVIDDEDYSDDFDSESGSNMSFHGYDKATIHATGGNSSTLNVEIGKPEGTVEKVKYRGVWYDIGSDRTVKIVNTFYNVPR